MTEDKCCLRCQHVNGCPIIDAWVKATQSPIESVTFYCSEYEREQL